MEKLHLEILPPAQRRLWDELIDVPDQFTLYGGTALALYLAHRDSVDFDFFGSEEFKPQQLFEEIPFLKDTEITQQSASTLTCLVDRGGPVQVSFFGVPKIKPIEKPCIAPDTGLKIASLVDLAGMKAAVVQQRAEAKDYIDLAALIEKKKVDLPTALAAARRIYPSFNPQLTLKALSFFKDGNLDILPEKTRTRLVEAVRDVDLDRLPELGEDPDRPRGDRSYER